MGQNLKDKVAIVTGGSRGIGAAIAKKLAQDGATVALSYSSSPDKAKAVAEEIKKAGGKAEIFKADQNDSKQVEGLIESVVKKFGTLDILVNNAGVAMFSKIDDPTPDIEALARLQNVNVASVIVAVRAAVKHMKKGGRIINIGSVNGERVPMSGMADYSASKAALIGYTKGWARDLGSREITVNIVQPGPIDTDMNPDGSDFAKLMMPNLAIPRYGKPEEVAAAVAFLASPEASYITSALLNVDGGFNA